MRRSEARQQKSSLPQGGKNVSLASMNSYFATLAALIATNCLYSPIFAQNTPQAPVTTAAERKAELYSLHFYPSWSQMKREINQGEAIPLLKTAVAEAQKKLQAISSLKADQMSYANTFGVMENMQDDMDNIYISIIQLGMMVDDASIRKAQEEAALISTSFGSDMIANKALWAALELASQQPWVKDLSPDRKRFMDSVLNQFLDNGAELSPEKQARVKEINKELALLTTQFSKNVLDSTKAWQLVITDPEQLVGMSENWMTTAANAALAKGYGTEEEPQWLVTLSFSSYGELLRQCQVEATRKAVWEGAITIGRAEPFTNEPLVHRIAKLRAELAHTLGFASYVDYITARRMVKNAATAEGFIKELYVNSMPAYEKERLEMLAFIGKKQGYCSPAVEMHPWDSYFYPAAFSKEKNQLDPNELRPYFPLDKIEAGMMELFSDLLDIDIKPIETIYYDENAPAQRAPEGVAEVWHPDVRAYEVYDRKSQKKLGGFYIDLHPRSNKRAGAWVMPVRNGESGRNGRPYTPHLACLVGNFTPPIGDEVALLSHREVVTLFHEFGHLLHGQLSDTTLRSQAGTSVAWDFVEMPSQLFEFWAWEPEFLTKHARHYKTGEPMPAELIEKLRQSKNSQPASAMMGQLNLALTDFGIHLNYDKSFAGRSLDEGTDLLTAAGSIPMSTTRPSHLHRFTHIISGGYKGTYYSYKWAEALSADAYTRFMKDGIMNKKTGAALREHILSKGDSADPTVLFEAFMGRKADSKALLRSSGLLPKE